MFKWLNSMNDLRKLLGTKVHLWSLGMPGDDIQILQQIAISDVSVQADEAKENLDLGILVQKLKVNWEKKAVIINELVLLKKTCIDYTETIINRMKHEHSDYMLSLQMNDDAEERPNLSGWVVRKIQKPEKGKEFGLLLPEEFEEFKVARKIVDC